MDMKLTLPDEVLEALGQAWIFVANRSFSTQIRAVKERFSDTQEQRS